MGDHLKRDTEYLSAATKYHLLNVSVPEECRKALSDSTLILYQPPQSHGSMLDLRCTRFEVCSPEAGRHWEC